MSAVKSEVGCEVSKGVAVLRERADYLRSGKDPKVGPGKPATFTAACQVGDCIPQGDLYIDIGAEFDSAKTLEAIAAFECPSDYELVYPTNKELNEAALIAMRQLVPGQTQGSRHCLDSLQGVTMYRPKVFNDENLNGPILFVETDRVIDHPKHGPVTLVTGFRYDLGYQREYAKELEREQRRNAD